MKYIFRAQSQLHVESIFATEDRLNFYDILNIYDATVSIESVYTFIWSFELRKPINVNFIIVESVNSRPFNKPAGAQYITTPEPGRAD